MSKVVGLDGRPIVPRALQDAAALEEMAGALQGLEQVVSASQGGSDTIRALAALNLSSAVLTLLAVATNLRALQKSLED